MCVCERERESSIFSSLESLEVGRTEKIDRPTDRDVLENVDAAEAETVVVVMIFLHYACVTYTCLVSKLLKTRNRQEESPSCLFLVFNNLLTKHVYVTHA